MRNSKKPVKPVFTVFIKRKSVIFLFHLTRLENPYKRTKFQWNPISSSKVIIKTAYFIQIGQIQTYGIFKTVTYNFLFYLIVCMYVCMYVYCGKWLSAENCDGTFCENSRFRLVLVHNQLLFCGVGNPLPSWELWNIRSLFTTCYCNAIYYQHFLRYW